MTPRTRMPLILTVDDEPAVRQSFRNFLEDSNFRVLEADNGRSGLELVRTARPDLVLLDLRMPEMDGLELLAEIRRGAPGTPLIVISGAGLVNDAIQALRLGAWDYLIKPVQDLEMLLHTVERALERARLIRQGRLHRRQLRLEVERQTRELREANNELRLAAATFQTQDAIAILDPDGIVERVNPAFCRLTGCDEHELVGRERWPRELLDGDADAVWNQIRAHGRWQGEIRSRHRDGGLYSAWVNVSAVCDDEGRPCRYVAISTDITELRHQHAMIERTAMEERVLAELSRLSLMPLELQPFLHKALRTLVGAVGWLKIQERGAIFLGEDRGYSPMLRLVAAHNLGEEVTTRCERVSFGDCLCGAAAEDRRPIFAVCSDDRHNREGACDPQGHYVIPILHGQRVLGVLTLYVPPDHQRSQHDEFFLIRVSDVLSLGILRRYAEDEIERRALHDGLTELPNRRLLTDRLTQELAVARRRGLKGALLFLDIDNFKTLNDSLGHSVGDQLLLQAAERLRATVRSGDTVARLGGDEFIILMPAVAAQEGAAQTQARHVAGKIQQRLARPFDLGGHSYQLSASIGMVVYPDEVDSAEDILKHADAAMYRAKAEGRDRIAIYTPDMQHEADQRLFIERELARALERRELIPYYQPQVDADGRILGVEVLLRWAHREQGLIQPGHFIPIAEETGLIVPIGRWLLGEVCSRFNVWSEAGHTNGLRHIAINVSPRQFHQPDFVAAVTAVVAECWKGPARLVLELTEGVLLRNIEEAIQKMQALKGLGVQFSIDDFGTGYSSLAYLKQLPIDELKIDQSFVRDVDRDPHDAMIAETIISMADHLELNVIAEGVESSDELQFLYARGCRAFQGFYFARPMAEGEFVDVLRAGSVIG